MRAHRRPGPGPHLYPCERVGGLSGETGQARPPTRDTPRDHIGDHGAASVLSTSPKGLYTAKGGYRLPADSADWVAYERAQFAATLTRISRLLDGTIAPHAMKDPDDRWARFVLAQATSLQSTLDMLANGSAPVGG